jgi:hypothetical protein
MHPWLLVAVPVLTEPPTRKGGGACAIYSPPWGVGYARIHTRRNTSSDPRCTQQALGWLKHVVCHPPLQLVDKVGPHTLLAPRIARENETVLM